MNMHVVRMFLLFLLMQLASAQPSRADKMFDDRELESLWPATGANACRQGCTLQETGVSYELEPIITPKTEAAAAHRQHGSAVMPYYIIRRTGPELCGSAGCPSVIVAIEDNGLVPLAEGLGIVERRAAALDLAALERKALSSRPTMKGQPIRKPVADKLPGSDACDYFYRDRRDQCFAILRWGQSRPDVVTACKPYLPDPGASMPLFGGLIRWGPAQSPV